MVFGHRGVRGLAGVPENTLSAFVEAARQGADGIELDVRLAGTGELVVFHDPSLDRLTGGADERAVGELSFAELRQVDLGGDRVPTAADVLAYARERRLAVNVEMKRDVPDRGALVLATARLLRSWDPAHPVVVSSFDPAMLARLCLAAPRLPLAQLVHENRWGVPAARAASLVADAVSVERLIASPRLVAALRRSGRIVNVWTVNSATEARDLAALGVDGLITDSPGAVLQALVPATR